jgi:tetratricopeptide (TPR) repeat protein
VGTIRETLERARQALIAGQADNALAPCQEVLARYPKHVEASCLLAETRRELRQLPQAAELFERVVAADPESVIGHWGLATIFEDAGDVEAALYELEVAWDVSPGQSAVAEEIARLRGDRLGRPVEVVELSGAGLARVYWRGHHYRRALAELRRELADRPERLDLMVLEAECLWRLGRTAAAAEVAAEILLESPDCLKANLIRGYARLDAGGRAADEARKLLSRALALDPECLVAATLFPDRPLPPPLVGGDVALDGEPVGLPTTEAAPARAPARSPLVIEAASAPAGAPVEEPAEPSVKAGEPVPEVARPEPAPGNACTAPLPRDEEEAGAAVPRWLAKDEAAEREALPGGLDPQLYAEWADLLGEEVELDADAVARLEAALAEATGGATTAGGWREVVLDGAGVDQAARGADVAPRAQQPPPKPVVAASDPGDADLPVALERVRALAALRNLDEAAEAYRLLLRAHPEAAPDLVEELCRLVDTAPAHGGLRRALGDAYMRSGRFQKAIEEYNQAAAAQQPAAVA